jgi:hypothetical protein
MARSPKLVGEIQSGMAIGRFIPLDEFLGPIEGRVSEDRRGVFADQGRARKWHLVDSMGALFAKKLANSRLFEHRPFGAFQRLPEVALGDVPLRTSDQLHKRRILAMECRLFRRLAP